MQTDTRFARRADWVWRARGLSQPGFANTAPPAEGEANRFVYFRRTFDLAEFPAAAQVWASADGRYQLFVNGQRVGRGPARSNPAWQCVDPYDIGPYLRPGRNVIAALAHSYGRNTAWYELPQWEAARAFGCGGFFLQGDVGLLRLDTGPDWRHLVSEAWQQNTPSGSLGFVEIYDARRAPADWADPDFDDSTWLPAEALRAPGRNTNAAITPFSVMAPRAIPALREAIARPVRVVTVGETEGGQPAPDVAAQLAGERLAPLRHSQIEGAEGLLIEGGAAVFRSDPEHALSIVLDFGRIVTGTIYLDLDGPAGATADFVCDERLQEDGRVRLGEGIPGFDIRFAHRYSLREGAQTWERFEWSGFRYLQVTFRNLSAPLRARAIAVNTCGYPVEARGSFECSDPLLNRLWQAGADTLRPSMQDAYLDCPSREQRQWVGDGYVETLINYVAFGDARLAAQYLRHTAQSQRQNGLTTAVAPGDFGAWSFFNIPDFCLHWILAIEQYVLYTGDVDILDELFPAVVKALAWFERHLNTEDLLTDVPHWVMIDWAELDKAGQVTALNAQYVAALRAAAGMAERVGAPRETARLGGLAGRTTDAINLLLWDDARGVYADARNGGRLSRRISQQSNAAVFAFGVGPAERRAAALSHVLSEQRLVLTRALDKERQPEVAFDEEHDVVLAQPFYMHFLHRAMAQAGLHVALLDNLRRRWAPMLEAGSTYWESWALIPITSMCHAFSATPTFDLSAETLGVTPLTPGFTRFRVAPQPADLAWARGVVPSPRGDIGVAWERHEAGLALTLDVPDGTSAEALAPTGLRWTAIDGRAASGRALSVAAGSHQFTASPEPEEHP
jgi:hypothetical protein